RRPAVVPPDQPPLRADLGDYDHQSRLRRMAVGFWRRQNDRSPSRPPHTSLRHRRDRQRELAVQEPRLIPAPLHAPKLVATAVDKWPACATLVTGRSGGPLTHSSVPAAGPILS